MSNSLRLCGPQPATILCPWDSPGKNTGVGCHAFLQGVFLTQGSNPHLLHCRQILYPLTYLEACENYYLMRKDIEQYLGRSLNLLLGGQDPSSSLGKLNATGSERIFFQKYGICWNIQFKANLKDERRSITIKACHASPVSHSAQVYGQGIRD